MVKLGLPATVELIKVCMPRYLNCNRILFFTSKCTLNNAFDVIRNDGIQKE